MKLRMWAKTFVFLMFLELVVSGKSQLTFQVAPQAVQPGVTPSMTLTCALLENDDIKVLTITISRKITRQEGSRQEKVATINSLSPRQARTLLRSPRLQVFGEIFPESDGNSYLKVIWPRPKADDLGVYTCEAQVLGEYGELVPLKAETQLSSSDPIQDRLLTIVQVLVSKLEGFDQTLSSLEKRLDNVTSQAVESEKALLERLASLANQTTALLTDAPRGTTTAGETTTTGETATAGETTTTGASTTPFRRFPARRRPIWRTRRTTTTTTSATTVSTAPPGETAAAVAGVTAAVGETAAAAEETTTAAAGATTKAAGETTTAAGETTTAAGKTTAALGETTTAVGETTTAAGETTTAAGDITTAAGDTTLAVRETTTIAGETTTASGETTTAAGQTTTAAGETTTAAGETTTAAGETTVAAGETTTASGETTTLSVVEATEILEEFLATTTLGYDTTSTITLQEQELIELLLAIRVLVTRLDEVNTTVVELEEKVNSIEPTAETANTTTDANKADTSLLEARIEELTALLDAMNYTVIVLEQKLETLEAKAEENETETNINIGNSKTVNENTTNTSESEQNTVTIQRLTATIEMLTEQLDQFNNSVLTLEEKVASFKLKELSAENETENNNSNGAEYGESEIDSDLTRHTLVASVEVLSHQLETVNTTLAALESKLALLESKETANETKPEPAADLKRYFVTLKSSYFLIKGTEDTDSYKAQAICESKQLYLAEINDQAEFDVVEIEIAPFVVDDWPIIVAGKRRSGRNDWIWQNTGNKVTYFTWAAGEPVVASLDNDCLALRTTAGLAEMIAVPCYVERGHFYFLCEKDL